MMTSDVTRARELRDAKYELEQIDDQIQRLKVRRKEIQSKIDKLTESNNSASSFSDIKRYEKDDFEWSSRMVDVCAKTFGIKSFRMLQKAAINATMSGVDCLLIMPTGQFENRSSIWSTTYLSNFLGGGKSLCFQLPALLKPGKICIKK